MASLGTDTVKNVLLYHLLGAKVGVATVLVSNGVRVPTLLAGTNFKINIRGGVVKLIDNDPNAKNPAGRFATRPRSSAIRQEPDLTNAVDQAGAHVLGRLVASHLLGHAATRVQW